MTTSGTAFETVALPPLPEENLLDLTKNAQTEYTTNSINQHTRTVKDGSVTTTLNYDEDGNLAEDDRFIYTWNEENRLTSIEPRTPGDGSKKLDFLYDYMGRRIQKTVTQYQFGTWTPLKTISFVYDGWNMIEDITASGGSETSRYFIWGLDLSQSLQYAGGIGGLMAIIDPADNKQYNYLYDANGNVGQIVDTADNTVAAHYEYSGFGSIINAHGDLADKNPYRFSTKFFDDVSGLYYFGYRYYPCKLGRWISRGPITEDGWLNCFGFVLSAPGQYYDSETGLHYNWHTYYDPMTGRYLTPDPIELAGGINPFVYVLNDPVNYTEPYALLKWHENWEGPDWTAGHKKSWNEFTPAEKAKIFKAIENIDVKNGAPTDLQDVQYMYHDFAYGTCRDNCTTATCPTECEKKCFIRADFELAKRLAQLSIKKPYWLKVWRTAPVFVLQPGFRNDEDGRYYQFRWEFD